MFNVKITILFLSFMPHFGISKLHISITLAFCIVLNCFNIAKFIIVSVLNKTLKNYTKLISFEVNKFTVVILVPFLSLLAARFSKTAILVLGVLKSNKLVWRGLCSIKKRFFY